MIINHEQREAAVEARAAGYVTRLYGEHAGSRPIAEMLFKKAIYDGIQMELDVREQELKEEAKQLEESKAALNKYDPCGMAVLISVALGMTVGLGSLIAFVYAMIAGRTITIG